MGRARQQSRHKAISIFPWEPGPAKARGLKFKSFRRARDRFKFVKFRGAGIQLFDDGSIRKRRAKRGRRGDDDSENSIKPHKYSLCVKYKENFKIAQKSWDSAGLA
jgi:hypothetical protein